MTAKLEPMRLDTVTLALVSTPIIALQGLLLLYSWSRSREVKALAWWGTSLVLAGAGLALLLLRGSVALWISITAGNAIVFLALGLFWTGFRVFEQRPPRLHWIMAGPVLWLAACGVPAVYKSTELRVLIASGLSISYMLAAAGELWRGRDEALGSRYPVIGLIGLHVLSALTRSVSGATSGDGAGAGGFDLIRLAILDYESLVFAIVMSFLVLNLTKERVEAEQRAISARDPLTGTFNRRAFLERARDLLDRARRARQTCSLIVADLDHFKSINDRFGHAAGDQVLKGLAHVAFDHLPAGSLTVRLGGEEFGVMLLGTQAIASALAEQLRLALEATRFETQHEAFSATVSLGIATTDDVGHILDAMMAAADLALYRAKALGRNRVEVTGAPSMGTSETSHYEKLSRAA